MQPKMSNCGTVITDENWMGLPVIGGSIQDKSVNILLDSGSQINGICSKTFRQLKNCVTEKPKSTLHITAVNGEKVHIECITKLELNIGALTQEITLYVFNCGFDSADYSVILGAPEMRKLRIIMDMEKGRVLSPRFKKDIYFLNGPSCASMRKHETFGKLVRKVSIPPKTEKLISVTCPKFVEEEGKFFKAELVNSERVKKKVTFSDTVFENKSGEAVIAVTNITDETISLNKLMKLADITDTEPFDEHIFLPEEKEGLEPLSEKDFDLTQTMPDEKENVVKFLLKNKDVIARDVTEIGEAAVQPFSIVVDQSKYKTGPLYKIPIHFRPFVREQLRKLEKNNIISRTFGNTKFNHPLLVVADSERNPQRLVSDFRSLNAATVQVPLTIMPTLQDILPYFAGKKFISTLDICSSFLQVPILPECREYTTFAFEGMRYVYNRMPFGLRSSSSHQQRVVEYLLADMIPNRLCLYVDDLVVFSATKEEHYETLTEIFRRFREVNLKFGARKIKLFSQENCAYLGLQFTPDGILPQDKNLTKVADFPIPKNKKQLRAFLGLCGYYRFFVPAFADSSAALSGLLRKRSVWEWTDVHMQAFLNLKSCLLSPILLDYPRNDVEIRLCCDASGWAVGSVLESVRSPEDIRPIAFFSRQMTDSQKRMNVTLRELLSIIMSLRHFKHILLGRKFKIFSDHLPLAHMLKMDNLPVAPTRWILEMQKFDAEIVFLKGKSNIIADYLSRVPPSRENQQAKTAEGLDAAKEAQGLGKSKEIRRTHSTPQGQVTENPHETNSQVNGQNAHKNKQKIVTQVSICSLEASEKKEEENETRQTMGPGQEPLANIEDEHMKATPLHEFLGYCANVINIGEPGVQVRHPTLEEIARYQKEDPYLKEIRDYVQRKRTNKPISDAYFLRDDVLRKYVKTERPYREKCFEERIVLPQKLLPVLLTLYHKNILVHAGFFKTFEKMKELYTFNNMYTIVKDYVSQCSVCAQVKTANKTIKVPHIEQWIPEQIGQVWYCDLVGPFVHSSLNNRYILTLMEANSRFANIIPIPDAKSSTVVQALYDSHIKIFGVMQTIVSDRGGCFISSEYFKSFMEALAVKHVTTSSYNASGNKIEKFHAILGNLLKCICSDPLQWCKRVTPVCLSYNSTLHSANSSSPYFLMFSRDIRLPRALIEEPQDSRLVTTSEFVRESTKRLWRVNKEVREKLQELARKDVQRSIETQRMPAKPLTEGQLCYLKKGHVDRHLGKKLSRKYQGIFRCVQIFKNNVRLQSLVKPEVNFLVHRNRVIVANEEDPLIHITPDEFILNNPQEVADTLLLEDTEGSDCEVEDVDVLISGNKAAEKQTKNSVEKTVENQQLQGSYAQRTSTDHGSNTSGTREHSRYNFRRAPSQTKKFTFNAANARTFERHKKFRDYDRRNSHDYVEKLFDCVKTLFLLSVQK